MSAAGHAHHHDHPPLPDHDTPQASNPNAPGAQVRLMCSFGGRIVPRPHDNQLRYVGGDTRIVSVNRSVTASALYAKLCKISGVPPDMSVKYQLPQEDLDSLISITTDEDVENMMEEYHRLTTTATISGKPTHRLRLFLFPPATPSGETNVTAYKQRQSWFVDALNGGGITPAAPLERGRSEGSSALSEVPDYLFGFDSSSDDHREGKGKAIQPPESAVDLAGSGLESPLPALPPLKTKAGMDVAHESAVVPHLAPQHVAPQPIPVYYVPAGAVPVQVSYGHQLQPAGMVQPGLAYMVPGSTTSVSTMVGEGIHYLVPVYDHFSAAGGGVHVGGEMPVTPVETTPTHARSGVQGFPIS